jgi:hypothetical protein
MNEPDIKVRRQVAAEHGLDWQEAKFLIGSTIEELHESAAKLADLLDKKHEQDQERPLGYFDLMATEKAERKRALAAIFTGRTPQPRDNHGRFATDFHGGARRPVPPRPETHGQTLTRLLRSREANAGRRL